MSEKKWTPDGHIMLGPGPDGEQRIIAAFENGGFTDEDGVCYPPDIPAEDNCARTAACLNACAGLNPEGIPDAVEVLRGLVRAFEGGLSAIELRVQLASCGSQAKAALAKLEAKP
jgi:hypothetical protein